MADNQITPFQLTDQFTMDNFNQRINETNITLQKKADTSVIDQIENDVNVLESRMNEFTSLPQGSTSGDAELADIRVGQDGTVYSTAGNAVRAQVNQLKQDLVEKINKPTIADNNKFPRAKDGNIEWVEQGLPTDEQTATAITEWLNEHPEATTTVQDGSLTYKKLVTGTLGYVTPQMFGAKGDGVTDDTTPIQKTVDYAHLNDVYVYMPKGDYYINTFAEHTTALTSGCAITIRSNVTIVGDSNATLVAGSVAEVNDCLIFVDGDNVSVNNLRLIGRNDIGSSSGGVRLIDCRGNHIQLDNITLCNNCYAGIRAFNCSYFTAKNITGYGVEVLLESLGDYANDFVVENVKTYTSYNNSYSNIYGECVALFATVNNRWTIKDIYSYGKTNASCLLIGSNNEVSRTIEATDIFATNVYLVNGTANYAVYVSNGTNINVSNAVVFGTTAFGLCYVSNSENVSISGVDNGSDGVNAQGAHASIVRVFNSKYINIAIAFNLAVRSNATAIIYADADTTGKIDACGSIPKSQYVELLGAINFISDVSNRFLSIASGVNAITVGICSNPSSRNGIIKQCIGWFDGASIGANMCKIGAAIQYYVVTSASGLDNLNSLAAIKTPEFVVFIRSNTASAITFTPVNSSTVIWSDDTPFDVSSTKYKVLKISSNGTVVFIDAG